MKGRLIISLIMLICIILLVACNNEGESITIIAEDLKLDIEGE